MSRAMFRAYGRDFEYVKHAERYGCKGAREMGSDGFILFLVYPGCYPVRLWHVSAEQTDA